MAKTVDARDLACPQPVILTRKAMAEGEQVTTIVNSDTSRDNVRRMAEKAGRSVSVEEKDGDYYLRIAGAGEPEPQPAAAPAVPAAGPLVLIVADNKMGAGDEQLGGILIRGFFHTLGEVAPLPDTIIFYNAGVWLALDDSPVIEDLKALEESGVAILSCGTCLNHYGVTGRLSAGVVSNMYDIAETILNAGKVIRL